MRSHRAECTRTALGDDGLGAWLGRARLFTPHKALFFSPKVRLDILEIRR